MLTASQRAEKVRESLIYLSEDKINIKITQVVELITMHFEHAFQSGFGQGIRKMSDERQTIKQVKKQKRLKKRDSIEIKNTLGYRSISVRSMLKNGG